MKQTRLRTSITRRLGWDRRPDNSIRHRIHELAMLRDPWWAWGPRLVVLTGSDYGGTYQEPKPPTWWYTEAPSKRQRHTGYPSRRYRIVTDWEQMRRETSEHHYDDPPDGWWSVGCGQDGELHLGRMYWGGGFYGLNHAEQRIVARWLRMARRHDWWGLRTWLWQQGLHASVHRRKPRSCHAVPARGSGGYNHWHCELPRHHSGAHRHKQYRWTRNNPVIRVTEG